MAASTPTPTHSDFKDISKMTVEDLLDECGGFGKFQVLIVFGIFIHKLLSAWSMMQISYAGYSPDWHCDVNGSQYYANQSLTLNKCSLNTSDTGFLQTSCWDYRFDESSRTIITEWDLVCDKKWVKATVTSIQMAGVLVGGAVSGQLADMFGRKKTLFGFALVHALLNFGAAFSSSWEMFAGFRFFIGAGIGAILVVTLPYGMEFMPTRWRPLVSVLPHWPMGVSLFALAAFVLQDWAYLHIGIGALCLPTMIGYLYVPESVRWLTLKGRYEEAEKVFEKMAAVNGKSPPKETRAVLEKLYLEEKQLKTSQGKYTYWDLFQSWQRAKISLLSCYTWFMISMVFYGFSFGVSALSGNLFLNIFIMGIVEVPMTICTFYFNNRVGRKLTFIVLLIVGAISSCACLVVKNVVPSDVEGRWITGLSITSKMVLAAAWTVSQTWVMELYPTVVRSLGYGLVNTAARLGGIVAPFSVDLDNRPMVAYATITAMVAVAIVASFFVPDTKGKVLSDSLGNTATSRENGGISLDVVAGHDDKNNDRINDDDNFKKVPYKNETNEIIVHKF